MIRVSVMLCLLVGLLAAVRGTPPAELCAAAAAGISCACVRCSPRTRTWHRM